MFFQRKSATISPRLLVVVVLVTLMVGIMVEDASAYLWDYYGSWPYYYTGWPYNFFYYPGKRAAGFGPSAVDAASNSAEGGSLSAALLPLGGHA